MRAKLYVLPGSHPCDAVQAGLRLKSIDYKRVDLLPGMQRAIGRIAYGGKTVPGLRIDGERLVGSRAILRRLDELVPDPALYPAELERRKAVLEAEAWGEEALQPVPRRLADALFVRRPRAIESYVGDARLALPAWARRPTLPLVARMMRAMNDAGDERVQADLEALPAQLDRIDAWIAEGVLGGSQPNAADLQIGSSVRLLQSMRDVAPLLAARPCERLTRYFPPLDGSIEAGTMPAGWAPPAAAAQARARDSATATDAAAQP